MSQNIFTKGRSWQNFQDLENRILQCFEYVALDKKHENVWSDRFGELLVRVGSTIDSFFYRMRDCDVFSNTLGIHELRQKNEPTISDYRVFFEPFYKLSEAEVLIQNGDFSMSYYPFKEFKSNDGPKWWKSYNKVKHEWFNSLSEHGTLINVVKALGSLFLLNVLHKDCQR
jgi:hypothetical protein